MMGNPSQSSSKGIAMSENQRSEFPLPATAVTADKAEHADLLTYKRRMLEWPNPVEYVNNMYGCHPGDRNTNYFQAVFGK